MNMYTDFLSNLKREMRRLYIFLMKNPSELYIFAFIVIFLIVTIFYNSYYGKSYSSITTGLETL